MPPPLGLLGTYLNLAMNDPVLKMARNPASRRFIRARPDIAALEQVSGMYAPDIDFLMGVAARGWILVCRCPNEFSYAYAPAVKSGEARPKPGGVYEKTDSHGVLGRFISDYDFMCAWRVGAGDGHPIKPVSTLWDGKHQLDPSNPGDELIQYLNRHLVYKLQHGFNDCWLDSAGNPKNRNIGDDFVAFTPGYAQLMLTQAELKTFYRGHGMPWRYG